MYKAKQFNLSGLKGISDQTLEMHFKLYEGYVKETNTPSRKDLPNPQGWQCRSRGNARLFGTQTAPGF